MEVLEALATIESNSYTPLGSQVYSILRDDILTGRLQPGARLVEEKVCKQLGVSRSPLREALRRLDTEGLVSTLPRRGAVVTQLTRQDVVDLFAVRESLEPLAAALAAESITSEELTELDEICEAMEQSISLQDMLSITKLNGRYHELIARASRNKWLGTFLASLGDHIGRVYGSSIHVLYRARQSLYEHREIAAALREGDAATAEGLSKRHVLRAKEAALSGGFGIETRV